VSDFVPVRISGVLNSDGGPLPTLHLNSFEWRIYHRSSISLRPVAHLAADKD